MNNKIYNKNKEYKQKQLQFFVIVCSNIQFPFEYLQTHNQYIVTSSLSEIPDYSKVMCEL